MDELKIKSSYLKEILGRLLNIVIRKKFHFLTKDKHLVINNIEITNGNDEDYYDINLSVSVSKGLITEIIANSFKA